MRDAPRGARVVSVATILTMLAAVGGTAGCAVHYFDPDTGVEHVLGFGHLMMKESAPREGLRSVVTGTDLIGLSLGRARDGDYLALGWSRRRHVDVVDENTEIDLAWPDASFENLRIGSEWPRAIPSAEHPTREGDR